MGHQTSAPQASMCSPIMTGRRMESSEGTSEPPTPSTGATAALPLGHDRVQDKQRPPSLTWQSALRCLCLRT